MSENRTMKERAASTEAHVLAIREDIKYIKENMVAKSSISFIKWSLGGIATLALAALSIAAGK